MTLVLGEITLLLENWQNGDADALANLTHLVYEELYKIAESYLNRQYIEHTLQATALVNEAYLRLLAINQEELSFENRTQFYGLAAQIMRNILTDKVRRYYTNKRGSGAKKVALEDAMGISNDQMVDLLMVDDLLNRLTRIDAQQSKIVELRFFGGLNIEETAEFLKISPATVKRDWRMARAWLRREMQG